MLFVRADGNAKIGAGHLMRCLTIAEELNMEDVCFLCADELSAQMVRDHGFEAKAFGTDYTDLESEFAASADGGQKTWGRWITDRENTILVDSYYVTDAYLEKLRSYGKVILMDDLQEHAYPVDAVINYNAFADAGIYENLYPDSVERYLGGAYIPLRKQFQDVEYELRTEAKHVMITTGGGDASNIAGAILEAIYSTEYEYHVLVGRFSPHFSYFRELEAKRKNLHIYFDVSDMASLMKQCDIGISAGGSTVYEFCAVGVPLICFSYAKNQEALVEYMQKNEICVGAGKWHVDREKTLSRIQSAFELYASKVSERQNASKKEKELVDGRGAKRISEAIMR